MENEEFVGLEDFREKIIELNEKLSNAKTYSDYIKNLNQISVIAKNSFPEVTYDIEYKNYYIYCAYILLNELSGGKCNILESKISKSIPFHAKIYGLIILPQMIYMLNENLTDSEWNDLKQKILEKLNLIFGENSYAKSYQELVKIINTDTSVKLNNVSAISKYKYLYGFTFDFSLIDTDIKNLSQDYNYLLINATYGLDKLDSILMYNDIPKMDTKLVCEDMLSKYIPYKYFPVKQAKSEYNEIVNLKKSNPGDLVWRIGIDYNNGFCTISREILTVDQKNKFLDGKVFGSISSIKFQIDLIKLWYLNFSEEKEDKNKIPDKRKVLMNLVEENFSEKNKSLTISSLKNKLHSELISPKEKIYFDYYIDNAINIEEWNKEMLFNYLSDYFIIDLT